MAATPIASDWATTTLHKRRYGRTAAAAPRPRDPRSEVSVPRAAAGDGGATAAAHRRLDGETERFVLPHVSASVAQRIRTARCAKRMTQLELATAVSEQAGVIRDCENGKAPLTQATTAVIRKMERVLGTRLRDPPLLR